LDEGFDGEGRGWKLVARDSKIDSASPPTAGKRWKQIKADFLTTKEKRHEEKIVSHKETMKARPRCVRYNPLLRACHWDSSNNLRLIANY
jgi:hypothetical protein